MERDVLLEQELKRIAADDTAGATDLTLRATEALQAWAMSGPPLSDAELQQLVRRVAGLRPSMAPFLNLADALARVSALPAPQRADAIAAATGNLGREIAGSPRQIANRLRESPPVERRIATYSAGATVRAALLALHHAGEEIEVVLSEARPGMEGRSLAETLASAGVPARLVVDAALPGELSRYDALWVGADAVTPDGLIHKVGTAPLTAAARAAGIPVRVLSARCKWLGPDLAPLLRLEEGDPAAVHPGGAAAPEARNPLFDLTPWERLDLMVSEIGIQPASKARDELSSLERADALAAMLS